MRARKARDTRHRMDTDLAKSDLAKYPAGSGRTHRTRGGDVDIDRFADAEK